MRDNIMHHQMHNLDSPSVITFSTERPRMLVSWSFIAQNAPTESCRCTTRIPWYHQNPAYTHRILFALTVWYRAYGLIRAFPLHRFGLYRARFSMHNHIVLSDKCQCHEYPWCYKSPEDDNPIYRLMRRTIAFPGGRNSLWSAWSLVFVIETIVISVQNICRSMLIRMSICTYYFELWS